MCGRFTIAVPPDELVELLELHDAPKFAPRYNAAPSQQILAVRVGDNRQREAAFFRWGLVPSWADDPKIGYQLINARGETIATKPSFRTAFKKRRCLIPADGFYEWLAEGKKKRPFRFHRPDGKAFLFAGLWEHREKPGEEPLETCSIVTTAANSVVRPFHERMPVILDRDQAREWIGSEPLEPDIAARLLAPAPDDFLVADEVSPIVNSPRVDDPRCIEPVSADKDLFN